MQFQVIPHKMLQNLLGCDYQWLLVLDLYLPASLFPLLYNLSCW